MTEPTVLPTLDQNAEDVAQSETLDYADLGREPRPAEYIAPTQQTAQAVPLPVTPSGDIMHPAESADEDSETYHLLSTGHFAPVRDKNTVVLSIRAASVKDLMSAQAKQFAYECRHEFGMTSAGIEKIAGPIPVTEDNEPDTNRVPRQRFYGYAATFRLTQGL